MTFKPLRVCEEEGGNRPVRGPSRNKKGKCEYHKVHGAKKTRCVDCRNLFRESDGKKICHILGAEIVEAVIKQNVFCDDYCKKKVKPNAPCRLL